MPVPMGGIIASSSYAMNKARKRREQEETPRSCREKGVTCANCYKTGCSKRGKGRQED